MPIPAIGYRTRLNGTTIVHALPRSEWPLFAAVSALVSNDYVGRGSAPADGIRYYLAANDVPESRAARWVESLSGQLIRSVNLEPDTLYPPDPYQHFAVASMSSSGGVLAMGCGLGKTLTAELWVASIAAKYTGKPLVIATTLTAFNAWQPYIPRFKKMGFSDVFLVSIDSLHNFEPGFRSDGGLLIYDEAHLLGSVKARRTRHALKLRLKMDECLTLSGTMFHGGVVRSLVTMNMAIPGLAVFGNSFSAATYFNCLKDVHVGDKVYKKIVRPTGDDAARFRQFVSQRFVVSLAKTSPIVRQSVTIPEQDLKIVELDGPWGSIHFDSVQEIRRAIANNEGIPHTMAVTQKLARVGIESKINWILDELADGESKVIFAKYTESLDSIEARFLSEDISYVRVDGTVTGKRRAEANAAFQEGRVQVFLGQMDAAGISIELFKARTSIAVDSSWKPDSYDQALARTCRRGQLHRCTHYDLVANNLQAKIIETVRSGQSFDAAITAYQDVRRAINEQT